MPPFPRRKCERRIWSRWIERCNATDSRCTAESTNERACHGRKAEGGAESAWSCCRVRSMRNASLPILPYVSTAKGMKRTSAAAAATSYLPC